MYVEYRVMESNISEYNSSDYKGTGIIFPNSPPPMQYSQTPQPICVETEQQLIKQVKTCDKRMNEPSCLIDICAVRLRVSSSKDSVLNNTDYSGIDLSNKNIVFYCEKGSPTKRCILDGKGFSRMFYGSSVNVTFVNFIFVNGVHPVAG
jgi:hypothetical protein